MKGQRSQTLILSTHINQKFDKEKRDDFLGDISSNL